jgi:hypothetical protein
MFAGLCEGTLLGVILCLAMVATEPPLRMALGISSDKSPWAQFAQEELLKQFLHWHSAN